MVSARSLRSRWPPSTRGGSRMRESRTYGSVRGALSNERPYRDRDARNDAWGLLSRRWRICHRLALRKGCDRRGADRALFVIEPTLADRDAIRGVMVHHLKPDPVRHRQAMQIDRHVAVDVAEALVTGIGKGAGEIGAGGDMHERRHRDPPAQPAPFAPP